MDARKFINASDGGFSPLPRYVDFSALRWDERAEREVFFRAALTDEGGFLWEGRLARPSEATLEGSLRRIGDAIEFEGRARCSLEYSCSRCLRGFSEMVDTEFDAIFIERSTFERSRADGDEASDSSSTEENSVDVEFYSDRARVDLFAPARDKLILQIPIQPLCRIDCAGLCQVCGADLNEKPDRRCHESEKIDPRLAVLLKLKKGGDRVS